MTGQTDPRDLILSAAKSRAQDAAFLALRSAAAWATAVLGDPSKHELSALELVVALDDALEAVPALAAAVSGLVRTADPGPDVADYLTARFTQLANMRERVVTSRRHLEEKSHTEVELRRLAREHEEIQSRVAELAQLERRVAMIPELTEQERVLAERAKTLRTLVTNAESDVSAAAETVLTLTRSLREDLSAEIQGLFEQIVDAEHAYADERDRHQTAIDKLRDVVERQDRMAGLRDDLAKLSAYTEVERELAEALSAAVGRPIRVDRTDVRDVLATMTSHVRQVDSALAKAQAEHEQLQTAARRALRYGEEPVGGPF